MGLPWFMVGGFVWCGWLLGVFACWACAVWVCLLVDSGWFIGWICAGLEFRVRVVCVCGYLLLRLLLGWVLVLTVGCLCLRPGCLLTGWFVNSVGKSL